VTDYPVKVRNLMDDSSKEVTGLDELTPEVVLISHLTKKDWIEEHDCSNVGKLHKFNFKIEINFFSNLFVDYIRCAYSFVASYATGCAFARMYIVVYR